jgi:hypothetical protein
MAWPLPESESNMLGHFGLGFRRGEPVFKPDPNDLYVSRNVLDEKLMPGASGSPIFDKASGEVIGVFKSSIGSHGIGAGIDHILPVLNVAMEDTSLTKNGKVLEVATRIHDPVGRLQSAMSTPMSTLSNKTVEATSVLNESSPISINPDSPKRAMPGALRSITLGLTVESFVHHPIDLRFLQKDDVRHG